MKKFMSVISLMFIVVLVWPASPARASIVEYGYTTYADNIYAAVSPNYLLGFAITVPQQMELTDVGIITRGFSSYVKVGIYSDSGGNPSTKLAQTDEYHLPANTDTLIPVINRVTLDPGTYWFMAVHDDPGAQLGGPGDFKVPIKYVSFNYDNALPTTFPTPSTYNGLPTSFYLAQVPEPATLAMLAFGGLLLRRRKNK